MSRANLAGMLDGPARRLADRPAVLAGDEPVRTWAGLAEAVARRAAGLRDRHGIAPGDAVALFAANCPEYLEILFSIWHAGAVAVPMSSRLHAREAAALLAGSRARVCFCTPELVDDLAAAAPGTTTLLVVGAGDDAALLEAAPMDPIPRGFDDDAWIFFTSGTTGRAKGARLSHGNLLAMSAAYHGDVAQVTARDSLLHVAALSHASGLFALPFLACGATQVLPASGHFDPAEFLTLVAANERSTFFVPPTGLRRLCEAAEQGPPVADRLGTVLVGAAPVPPADLKAAVAALGPSLWNGYGQGETPCTITALDREAIGAAVRDRDDAALGTVGVARVGTRVRLVDPEGAPVTTGEVGEVVVDGPTVMSGYLDMPAETAEALRGGWLHTGDLGRFDERGRLTLVDRAKDVVITGGFNVYPREVEDVLLADPSVAEAAIVGVPDAEWGERVVAFVVPAPGSSVDRAALDRRCLDAIARHKRPKEYRVLDALPRNAAGKVLKKALRDEATAAPTTEGTR